MENEISNLFGGENAQEFNALMRAIENCASNDEVNVYEFLHNRPKTTLVVSLVDELNRLGYHIIKVNQN